jgi:hypothetical protein
VVISLKVGYGLKTKNRDCVFEEEGKKNSTNSCRHHTCNVTLKNCDLGGLTNSIRSASKDLNKRVEDEKARQKQNGWNW